MSSGNAHVDDFQHVVNQLLGNVGHTAKREDNGLTLTILGCGESLLKQTLRTSPFNNHN